VAILIGLLLGLASSHVRADGAATRAVGLAGSTETARAAAGPQADEDDEDLDGDDEATGDEATGTHTGRRRFDYSRFSDGPRRVPRPRGASLRRATALGLGTREAAHRLLHARPEPRWVEASRGEVDDALLWPVALGRFGRGFGFVRRTRPDLRHDGVDVVAAEGSVVRAAADGIVAYSDNGVRGFGNFVILVHPNGWVTTYAHLYRATVQPGWRVARGERIGFVGNTGISRGPHLHFELHVEGRAVNPLPHFDGRPWIGAYREWQRRREAGTYAPPTDHLTASLSAETETGAGSGRRSDSARPSRGPRAGPGWEEPSARAAAETGVAAGSLALARALLDEGALPDQLAAVEGPLYSTLLWPARGGHLAASFGGGRRGVRIDAETGTPVRAAADGLVVYVGTELRGVGRAVVLLHRNGWVTVYGSAETVHVEPGQQVQRGAWIAEVGTSAGGAPHLYFQVRSEGSPVDPGPLLVQVPED